MPLPELTTKLRPGKSRRIHATSWGLVAITPVVREPPLAEAQIGAARRVIRSLKVEALLAWKRKFAASGFGQALRTELRHGGWIEQRRRGLREPPSGKGETAATGGAQGQANFTKFLREMLIGASFVARKNLWFSIDERK
jgi:hypothetical protein